MSLHHLPVLCAPLLRPDGTIPDGVFTDILQDIEPILGPDVVLIQAGALDTMTLDEVRSLRPDGQGNTLVSRMRDGTAVTLQEQKILPLIYPSKVICNIIAALNNVRSIGVITPDADQIPDIEKKW